MKRECMTRSEWRKHNASLEKPALDEALIGTTVAYLTFFVVLLAFIGLW